MFSQLDAIQAVRKLSEHFGLPVPEVRFTTGKTSSVTWYKQEEKLVIMKLSTNDWHGMRDATLHEFTHVILAHRVGRHGHDYRFFQTLCDVIYAFGMAPEEYGWHNEYRSLYGWAWGKYTRKPYFKSARPQHTPQPTYRTPAEIIAANRRPPQTYGG